MWLGGSQHSQVSARGLRTLNHREQLGVGGKKVVRRSLPISSFADDLHLKVINATGSRYGMGGTH